MFATLKRLWDAGKLTLAALANAVAKLWITAEQADEITDNTPSII